MFDAPYTPCKDVYNVPSDIVKLKNYIISLEYKHFQDPYAGTYVLDGFKDGVELYIKTNGRVVFIPYSELEQFCGSLARRTIQLLIDKNICPIELCDMMIDVLRNDPEFCRLTLKHYVVKAIKYSG